MILQSKSPELFLKTPHQPLPQFYRNLYTPARKYCHNQSKPYPLDLLPFWSEVIIAKRYRIILVKLWSPVEKVLQKISCQVLWSPVKEVLQKFFCQVLLSPVKEVLQKISCQFLLSPVEKVLQKISCEILLSPVKKVLQKISCQFL